MYVPVRVRALVLVYCTSVYVASAYGEFATTRDEVVSSDIDIRVGFIDTAHYHHHFDI